MTKDSRRLPAAAAAMLEHWTQPPPGADADALRYWQERVLQTVLLVAVAFGFLAYVPSLWLSFMEGLWSVAALDTAVYMGVLLVFYRRDWPYMLRCGTVVSISYLLGLILLAVVGPFGAGPVWLFAAPVFAGLLMGLRAALIVLAVTAATLAATGGLIWIGWVEWPHAAGNPVAKWLVSSVNFLLLDTATAISLTVLLQGLRTSLHHEKALRAAVEAKHGDLTATHRQLSRETLERRQANDALKESETRLQMILDAVHAGILIIDATTLRIVDANPSAVWMIGEDRPAIIGQPCHRYSQDLTANRKFLRPDAAMTGAESTLQAADGQTRPILLNVTPVTLNRRPHLLASFLDISQLREAEMDRARLETQLAQAHKMEAIGTLAGGIAHDFNNILSAVIGFTELAIDGTPEDAPLSGYLQEIHTAGLRAKELVWQILAFSRREVPTLRPVALRSLVEEALKLIRASLPATITIDAQMDSDAPVMADATQIHQVLMNLCTNAWHAMEDGGGILRVGLTQIRGAPKVAGRDPLPRAEYLHLQVCDNGCGMDPEVTQRVFEPFFTTKPAGEGTGMGLAVVHGIVQNHGGTIGVRSAPGQGTTVDVYLPVARVDAASPAAGAGALPGGRERILVVDDEPAVAEAMCRTLEGLGYTVTKALRGENALDALRNNRDRFDLLITDMAMPGISGDRLVQAAHRLCPGLPVVLCTGYSRRLSAEKAEALGATALAFKPLTRAELAPLIRRVLDDHSRRVPADRPV